MSVHCPAPNAPSPTYLGSGILNPHSSKRVWPLTTLDSGLFGKLVKQIRPSFERTAWTSSAFGILLCCSCSSPCLSPNDNPPPRILFAHIQNLYENILIFSGFKDFRTKKPIKTCFALDTLKKVTHLGLVYFPVYGKLCLLVSKQQTVWVSNLSRDLWRSGFIFNAPL